MRDRVCYKCADLHPVPLKGKCHIFCSRKAAHSRICKIAVRYDRLSNKNKLEFKGSLFFFFFFFFVVVVVVVLCCYFFFFFFFFFFSINGL